MDKLYIFKNGNTLLRADFHLHTKNGNEDIKFGSIDEETIRKGIVNIMEGGKEAFNNRKRIYELWTQ